MHETAGIGARGLLAALTCAVLAGCGSTSQTTSVPVETADPLPKLPASWHPYRDNALGFAIGVASGWRHDSACKAAEGGQGGRHQSKQPTAVTFCAPDLLTTVSVAPDRGLQALEVPVDEFATRAFDALSKKRYGDSLRGGEPQPFGDLYDGAEVSGRGTIPRSGFEQEVAVIVLRREQLVNFTVVVASNARRAPKSEQLTAERMVRTLRDEPVEHGVGSSAPLPDQASGRSG
jgi:hypothetical protein